MNIDLLALVMRWAHILAAITAVGGSIFLRFVLMPAMAATAGPEEQGRLRGALLGPWQRIVHVCIALLVISGFYNYLVIARHAHEGQALYHALAGVKILLAFAVFFLAIALTSRRDGFAAIKAQRARWTGVLIALAVAVVLLSGVLRSLPATG